MTRDSSTRAVLYVVLTLTFIGAVSCERQARPTTAEESAVGRMTVRGIPDLPDEVTMMNGRWDGEAYVAGAASRPSLHLDPSTLAAADADGDGAEETFAVIVASTGGSGSFYYLTAFRSRDGGLDSVAVLFLGDRIKVDRLIVDGDAIRLELVEHGDGDPMCCPTRRVSRQYSLDGDLLEPTRQIGAGVSERLWGHVVWAHESRYFESCDGSRRAWLIDGVTEVTIADLYREFASDDYAPVFFDVEARRVDVPDTAFAANYDEAIEIVDVLRVEREGFGCRLAAEGLILLGFGNEPGWRLDLHDNGATFTSLAMDVGASALEIPGRTRFTEQGLVFESTDASLSASARKQPCRDSMSGTFFSHTVELRHNDRLLSGCGVPGYVGSAR